MDRAVLDAYGWTDIATEWEFLPEHETDNRRRTASTNVAPRCRWPNGVGDEVLARLLELNAERAREES